MHRPFLIGAAVLAFAAAFSTGGTARAGVGDSGATPPGESAVLAAAAKLNSVTPQGIPTQTIKVGSYDAATKTFTWSLIGDYPPGSPVSRQCPPGGEQPPGCIPASWHAAHLNSYDVTYEFVVKNAPNPVKVTLTDPNGNGSTSDITVSSGADGVARIPFHPHSSATQTVHVGSAVLAIHPSLQPQLGAFVAPYVLLSIVYEPFGAYSYAEYDATNTVGSTVTWGFARTSGLVETDDPNQMRTFFTDRMGDAAAALGGGDAAKTVIQTLSSLAGENVTTITTQTTTGTSQSVGSSLTITSGFDTGYDFDNHVNLYPYPGQGDVFVVMRDVLFAYVVSGESVPADGIAPGRVILAPLAYAAVDHFTAAQLPTVYPSAVASKMLALDPMLTGTPSGGSSATPVKGGRPVGAAAAPRFVDQGTNYECVVGSGEDHELTSSEFQTNGVSQATSQTVVEHPTGLVQSIEGTPDTLWGYTQSTAVAQTTANATTAKLHLECGSSDGPHWVTVRYDNLFRTFLALKGASMSAQATVSGTVGYSRGGPARRQPVTLTIGTQSYVVRADSQGRFGFRLASIPKGHATLTAGRTTVAVSLAGNPVHGLKLTINR